MELDTRNSRYARLGARLGLGLALLACTWTTVGSSALAQHHRGAVRLHPAVGVDNIRLGWTERQVRAEVRFVPHPTDARATRPYTVDYRSGIADVIIVRLADTTSLSIGPFRFEPDASYGEVLRRLADCEPSSAQPGIRAARCLGGAVVVVGYQEPPFEVAIATSRFDDRGPDLSWGAGRSLGPIRIGMGRQEVARAVRLRPAPVGLYPSNLNASNTVPYAIRYDSSGHVSAVFAHQLYLLGTLTRGTTRYLRSALSPTNVDRDRLMGRARLPDGAELHNRGGYYIFGVTARAIISQNGAAPASVLRITRDAIGPIRIGMTRADIRGLGLLQQHPRFSAMTIPYNVIYDGNDRARIIEYRLTGSPVDLVPAPRVRIARNATWQQMRRISGLGCQDADVREGGSTMHCLAGRLSITRASSSRDIWVRIEGGQ